MRFYSVHAPPEKPAAAERFLFVKDGFSWPALFVPVLYLLWHRLWVALVYYVVFALVVAWVARLAGDNLAVTLAVIGTLLFALEANNMRRAALDARGWTEVGGSFGRDIEEAEARFFGRWPDARPASPDESAGIARAAYAPGARDRDSDQPVLGLFPEPER